MSTINTLLLVAGMFFVVRVALAAIAEIVWSAS